MELPRYGLRPDLVTLNSVLGVLMVANKCTESLALVNALEDKYGLTADVITYSTGLVSRSIEV